MLTRQEAFNRAWQEFVVDRKPPAKDKEGYCAYRGKDGSRCHVGLLIPDRLYRPKLEGTSPTCKAFNHIAEALGWSADDRAWLERFQDLHDDKLTALDTGKDRERLYREFAIAHNLTVPA